MQELWFSIGIARYINKNRQKMIVEGSVLWFKHKN